jgi:tetrahydromethanopterin S-methyltransferase subunit E
MLRRIGQFVVEMCKTWGALLTGGFIIAIISIWQFTGHNIPTKVGWSLIMGAIIIAAFQVWNRQYGLRKLRTKN